MVLAEAGIPFTEKLVRFGEPRFGRQIRRISPAATVPVLVDGKLVISDSLAIIEYLAERFPGKHIWPKDKAARAMARSAAAEMHAGFAALRKACPMNLHRPPKPVAMDEAVLRNVARIETLWRQCRKAHGKGGPFLFGRLSAADAMYAPVATRFETYAIPVATDTRAYMDAIFATRSFQQWKSAALKEKWIEPQEEK
jgi:glutathione S-transferase